ncbi:hypothetical protein MA16_Dca011383 [Dendrobium catenatum]|uniref:Uncharacterized protein n=1 Tax=Dendrobium catenatum TaxID=906689 RepID=A0A2I0WP02_9ASPA|nr:hypothetical protein MA16_Dca011383 [Dendrobium catenatum]
MQWRRRFRASVELGCLRLVEVYGRRERSSEGELVWGRIVASKEPKPSASFAWYLMTRVETRSRAGFLQESQEGTVSVPICTR